MHVIGGKDIFRIPSVSQHDVDVSFQAVDLLA